MNQYRIEKLPRRAKGKVEQWLALSGPPLALLLFLLFGLLVQLPFFETINPSALSDAAREAFEKSVALDPKHVPGLLGLSRYYLSVPASSGGDIGKANDFAKRVSELDPYQGEFELGRIAQQVTLYAVALPHFEAAAQLKPTELAPQVAAAVCLAQVGRREEARARLEQILATKPGYTAAQRALEALDELESKKK